MIQVGFEPLARLLADGVEALLERHWDEVALHKDAVPLAPDWDKALMLERHGMLRCITARDETGALVGYNAFLIATHLHYRRTLYAVNDVVYLAPEHRKGRAGVKLIREAERLLAELGVAKIVYHAKLHVLLGSGSNHDTVGGLLERLGYKQIETVHAKVLGD